MATMERKHSSHENFVSISEEETETTEVSKDLSVVDKSHNRRKKSDSASNSSSHELGSTGSQQYVQVPSEDTNRSVTPSQSPDNSPKLGEMKIVPSLGSNSPTPSPLPSSREPSIDKFGDSGDITNGLNHGDLAPTKKASEKKRKNPWYNMINPNYKSKSDDFKKLFKDLPDSERLIVDYSCALQKDILVHGRLYISQNYFCFYANIFRWETLLMIRCKDVTSMTKEKTALVIPNAIQVTTETEKHFFTSFGARDKTYLMLFRIWQNALMEQPMSSQELWQWVHYSYGEELGLTSDDDDYVAPPPLEDDVKTFNHNNNQHHYHEKGHSRDSSGALSINNNLDTPSPVMTDLSPLLDGPLLRDEISDREEEKIQKDKSAAEIPTDMSDTTESDIEENMGCGCVEHEGKEIFTTVVPLPVDQVFTLVFTGTKFYHDLLHYRKTYDIVESPWQVCSDAGHKMRQVTYTLTLNHAMAKSAHTTETQRLLKHSKSGQVYIIDIDILNTGIPYADTFMVKATYCLTRVSNHHSRIRVHGHVSYKKSVWALVKSLLEKSAVQGLAGYCVDLEVALLKEAEKSVQVGNKKPRRRKRAKLDAAKVEPESPIALHSQSSFHKLGANFQNQRRNSDTVIKVILCALIVLVLINVLLFYRLWALEDQTVVVTPYSLASIEATMDNLSKKDFIQLLRQQDSLHRSEKVKWQSSISEILKLVNLIETSLTDLKGMIDNYTLDQKDL